jgi:hypothetical protein
MNTTNKIQIGYNSDMRKYAKQIETYKRILNGKNSKR